jgi:hypothetical protein
LTLRDADSQLAPWRAANAHLMPAKPRQTAARH